jgi:hypothetical protein
MTLLAFLSLTCGLVLDTVMCGRIETKRMHYWSVSLRFNPLRTVAWRMPGVRSPDCCSTFWRCASSFFEPTSCPHIEHELVGLVQPPQRGWIIFVCALILRLAVAKVLIVGAWATRNDLAYGEVVLVNSAGGWNFWVANNSTYAEYGNEGVVPPCVPGYERTECCRDYRVLNAEIWRRNLQDVERGLVLAVREHGRQLRRKRAVHVCGSALASDPYEQRNPVMFDASLVRRLAAATAYEMAGAGPEDLDLVELHDCFATAELLHYENLGLCGPDESGAMIDRGDTWLGGKIPVNVSGGLRSKGHPIGATGIANTVEIVQHLRGEAGQKQVAGARLGLAHVLGFGAAAGVHMLEKV